MDANGDEGLRQAARWRAEGEYVEERRKRKRTGKSKRWTRRAERSKMTMVAKLEMEVATDQWEETGLLADDGR